MVGCGWLCYLAEPQRCGYHLLQGFNGNVASLLGPAWSGETMYKPCVCVCVCVCVCLIGHANHMSFLTALCLQQFFMPPAAFSRGILSWERWFTQWHGSHWDVTKMYELADLRECNHHTVWQQYTRAYTLIHAYGTIFWYWLFACISIRNGTLCLMQLVV